MNPKNVIEEYSDYNTAFNLQRNTELSSRVSGLETGNYFSQIIRKNDISEDHNSAIEAQNYYDQAIAPGHVIYNSINNGLNQSLARVPDDYMQNIPMNHTLVPLYHTTNNTTTFVNSKQYQPILRLRCKKIKRMKKAEAMKLALAKNLKGKPKKPKVKYESRSKHAITRQRAKNGKFLSKEELMALNHTKVEDTIEKSAKTILYDEIVQMKSEPISKKENIETSLQNTQLPSNPLKNIASFDFIPLTKNESVTSMQGPS